MIKRLLHNKKGSVLTVTIVVMAVIIVLSVTLLGVQGSELKLRKATEDRIKARYVAEAGVEATISAITKALQQGLNQTPVSTNDILVPVSVNSSTINGNKYGITKDKSGTALDNVVFKVTSTKNSDNTYSYYISDDQGAKEFEIYSLGQLYNKNGSVIKTYSISAIVTFRMDIENKLVENYSILKWEEER